MPKPPIKYFQGVSLSKKLATGQSGRTTATVARKTPSTVAESNECLTGRKLLHNNSRNALLYATTQGLLRVPESIPHHINIRTLSAEDIENASVVTITSADLDPNVQGGINDKRMGCIGKNEQCCTCFQIVCQGHFGMIPLKYLTINPLYWRTIIHVMNSVCNGCGSLLIDPDHNKAIGRLTGANRLAALSKASAATISKSKKGKTVKNITCSASASADGRKGKAAKPCKPNPIFDVKGSKGKNYIEYIDPTNPNAEKQKLYPDKILETLDSISDETAIKLGFSGKSHPRNMIFRNFPVIPPIARPGMIGRSFEEPTTRLYRRIVSINNSVPKGDKTFETISNDLFTAIYELIIAPKKKANEDARSLTQQVTGKDAIIRGAMMGKRVDMSARAVLSPGWMLMFGQIGVPESFGEKWQMPVIVTPDNIEAIKDLYRQGKIKTYESVDNPGIVIHIRKDTPIILKPGDIVKRCIDNGDAVTFNRQPSLHKGSFLGYTASMIKDTVIRLHPSSTTPHNADFDGDAAHMYFTENINAIMEIFLIMHAGNNLMNEKSNKPLVGLVMDTISSAWLMCKPDEGMDPRLFNDIIKFAKHKTDPNFNIDYLQYRAGKYGLHPYSGRTLFSCLFKDDFFYEKITDDGTVMIFEGILSMGRIRATHIGTDHRSILQDLWHQFDNITGCDFLTEGTWLLVAWLNTFGLSIGPADCEFGRINADRRRIEKENIDNQLAQLGDIPSDSFKARIFENKVISLVDQSKVIGKDITTRSMRENAPIKGRQNTIAVMVLSGAKAGVFNIAQIGVSAGQQYTSSQRPNPRLSGGTRFLPTQPRRPKNKLAPITERGYCVSSYWEGMTPEEMFYLFWGARQNLIDTSRSTADVGATQRSISKALESMVIMLDGSGRDVTGPYYFPIWGGDGLDSEALLQVQTNEFGSVPSFVDLSTLARKHNMIAGWMPEVMLSAIEENRRNYQAVEDKIKRYANPTDYPSKTEEGILYTTKSNMFNFDDEMKKMDLVEQINQSTGIVLDLWSKGFNEVEDGQGYLSKEELNSYYSVNKEENLKDVNPEDAYVEDIGEPRMFKKPSSSTKGFKSEEMMSSAVEPVESVEPVKSRTPSKLTPKPVPVRRTPTKVVQPKEEEEVMTPVRPTLKVGTQTSRPNLSKPSMPVRRSTVTPTKIDDESKESTVPVPTPEKVIKRPTRVIRK